MADAARVNRRRQATYIAELVGELRLGVVAVVDQSRRPMEVRLSLAVVADLTGGQWSLVSCWPHTGVEGS